MVVRVYRPWVSEARLRAIQHTRQHLIDHGIPCAAPIPAAGGDACRRLEGHLVEVEPYVTWDGVIQGWERIEHSLPMLGRIHTVLADLPASDAAGRAPASNSIARADVGPGVAAAVARLRECATSGPERSLADEAQRLADRLTTLEADVPDQPYQLVHGDYWDNNVLYRDGEIVLVADLDFLGARPRTDDLALTLYYTSSTFEDRANPERRAAFARLVDAYDSGLDVRLSTDERRAIPLAIVRTALGFVAMIADADTDEVIHRLAREAAPNIAWASPMLEEIDAWTLALT